MILDDLIWTRRFILTVDHYPEPDMTWVKTLLFRNLLRKFPDLLGPEYSVLFWQRWITGGKIYTRQVKPVMGFERLLGENANVDVEMSLLPLFLSARYFSTFLGKFPL